MNRVVLCQISCTQQHSWKERDFVVHTCEKSKVNTTDYLCSSQIKICPLQRNRMVRFQGSLFMIKQFLRVPSCYIERVTSGCSYHYSKINLAKVFSLLAPDALQKYYTEFLPLKCHQHKHSDFLKDTLRLANFHAASEFQFSKFPSVLSLTHPITESRKGKSMFVGIETQKNNPIGGIFIMLKTLGVQIFYTFHIPQNANSF